MKNTVRSVCIYQRFLPPDPSGAGKQALTLARVVRDAGWNVILIADAVEGETSPTVHGVPVVRVLPPPADPSNWQILMYWLRVARALFRIRRRFDVLQVHTADFHHVGAVPVARLLGKRVLVRSSLSGEFANLSNWKGGHLQRQMLRFADAFVVLSQRLAAEYHESGLPPAALNLIANGVDSTLYHPVSATEKARLRAELDLPADGTIMVFHGVFMERKSLHWLVDVLGPRLCELGLTLLLVGGPARDEPTTGYAARLRDQIAASPFRERIIVRDHDPRVHRYLQASDTYILPSTGEGLPNALLEAMAVGLLPFVSRTSGSEDVIAHGVSGYLFEPRDALSLMHCLDEVFASSQRTTTAEVANAAVERIQHSFSIHATGMQYIQVYERLAGIAGVAQV